MSSLKTMHHLYFIIFGCITIMAFLIQWARTQRQQILSRAEPGTNIQVFFMTNKVSTYSMPHHLANRTPAEITPKKKKKKEGAEWAVVQLLGHGL
jgi:hypothetical protein